MAKKQFESSPTGMIFVVSYFLLLSVNSLVIWVANLLFPNHVVLGTLTISKGWAILHSMTTLTLINVLVIPVVRMIERRRGMMFSSRDWMVFYFVLNTIGVWITARLADQLGLGISSWIVAAALGVVLDFVQGMVMMKLEGVREKLA